MESNASTQPSTSQSEKSNRRGRQKPEEQADGAEARPVAVKVNRKSLSPMPTRRPKGGSKSKAANSLKTYKQEFVFEPTEAESVLQRRSETKGSRQRPQQAAIECPSSARSKNTKGSVEVDRHKMFVRQISASGSIASRISNSTPTPGMLRRSLSMRATNSLRAHPSMSKRELTRGMSTSNVQNIATSTRSSRSNSVTRAEKSLRPHPSMSDRPSSRARSSSQSVTSDTEMHSSMPMLETFNLSSSSLRAKTKKQNSTSQLLSKQQRNRPSQQRALLTPHTSVQRPKVTSRNSQRHLISPGSTITSLKHAPSKSKSSKKISPKRNVGPAQLVFTPDPLVLLSPVTLDQRGVNDDDNDQDNHQETTKATTITAKGKNNIKAQKNLLKKTMALATRLVSAQQQLHHQQNPTINPPPSMPTLRRPSGAPSLSLTIKPQGFEIPVFIDIDPRSDVPEYHQRQREGSRQMRGGLAATRA